MPRTRRAAAVAEPVEELEELEELTEDEDDLEELEVPEEPAPTRSRSRATKAAPAKTAPAKATKSAAAPAKATKAAAAPAETSEYDSNWLASYVSEESGVELDARQIRMLLRKMAKDGDLDREVGTDRSRYVFPKGPGDPIVKAVLRKVKSGESRAVVREGLEAVKAAKSAAPTKTAPAKATKAAAPAKATTTRSRTRPAAAK